VLEPDKTTKAKLQNIVNGIIAAWGQIRCGLPWRRPRKQERLRSPPHLNRTSRLYRKVNAIIVEFADTNQQNLLDRLTLEGEDIPREQLRAVWTDTSGKAVWESPIYEAFLRTLQKINLQLPGSNRLRLIGDNSTERNRGRFIRHAVSREILDKRLKALAVYGSEHCETRGMGFPGELRDKYHGPIWAASGFYNVEEGRRVFNLDDEAKLIEITGTNKAKLPVGKIFFLRSYNDPATLGDLFDAIIYYGSLKDVKVPADRR